MSDFFASGGRRKYIPVFEFVECFEARVPEKETVSSSIGRLYSGQFVANGLGLDNDSRGCRGGRKRRTWKSNSAKQRKFLLGTLCVFSIDFLNSFSFLF
jgi:hypothetical protein